MKSLLAASVFATSCLISSFSFSANSSAPREIGKLIVTSKNISSDQPILEKYAYCTIDGRNKTKLAVNVSPHLEWTGAPSNTKSFAIVMYDPDVPISFENVNLPDKLIQEDFPRQNFYHWVVTDLPADSTEIPERGGKNSAYGISHINDYATFIKDKPAQNFVGYDGPCPPFNDVRVHNYHYVVYALDVPSLGKGEMDNGRDVVGDIEKHALAKGEIVATYTNHLK